MAALAVACTTGGTPVPAAPPAVTTSVAPAPVTETVTVAPPPPSTPAPRRTTAKAKPAPSHSRAACLRDENQCYEPGTNVKCSTGGCVNAARGLTDRDVRARTQQWLREHPGWCAAGETGAVAPC
ncbi:hypothetical protein FHX82_005482 [Amycolatopsis bartoniae]|uniref:hypothetical protein n=1 Tax=Amycolatopsis bartoniae TaxID=941986 RepID=UPI00119594C9|nr:hypothetical protein [Amycolatopsis bartoniae]MBB2938404.1 hypothetical protein [Amycolatopsis bartoniae]TVT06102.1 hypothetical protein FNH07_21435 [Amycolatopsis bartoniae]